jgi:uncharacterized protein (DUF302 family)
MRILTSGAAVLLAACLATGTAAQAGGVTTYEVAGEFDEVAFGVESAIVGRGFVVDYVSHVGEMLNRTATDVGATTQVFNQANVYLFCSAVLSRKMMEADADNIGHCPYGIFVYERAEGAGTVHVGYRHMPDGPMQEVQGLLDEIAREAAGLD